MYTDTLKPAQKTNADILIQRMNAKGITNPNTQAGILSIVSKESEFIPQNEDLNYSAERIAQVFKKVPANLIPQLAHNPQALGNYVYGPSYNPSLGNSVNEGYKYRGRGYNGITGKNEYKKIGSEIGVDLVSDPDKLNDPSVAADAAIVYFKDGINDLLRLNKLKDYNATNINDFKTVQDSVGAFYHVNAGVGSSKAKLDQDVTGGKAKATSRVSDLLNFITKTTGEAVTTVKQNPITSALITAGLVTLLYFFFKSMSKN